MRQITPKRRVQRRIYSRKVHRRTAWVITRPDISVVVPVLCEAGNILPLVDRIHKALAKFKVEILFVDDSPDNQTVEMVTIARRLHRSREFDVQIYHREGSKNWGGLSGAVVDGIERASNDKIVIMDGDLQHPPETVPDMIAASESSDIVVASRYVKGGNANGLDGQIRHLVSRGSTLLAKIFFPLRLHKVSDPMTGFFLINRSKVDRSKLRPKGFKILLEILATHHKLSSSEVPFKFAERFAGESHGSLRQGLEFLSQLIILRSGQLFGIFRNPPKLLQFGAIGGSVFLLGMSLLAVMVEVLGWSPLPANAVQLAVTFWLNYVLNRNITWRERNVSRLAAHKFLVSRSATTGLNYLMFAGLISISINYLLANVITLLMVTAINYVVSDRWAFADTKNNINKRPKKSFRLPNYYVPTYMYIAVLATMVACSAIAFGAAATLIVLLAIAGFVLFLQASLEVWRMVYAYREPDSIDRLRFPTPAEPQEKFCIIVPARHESAVIATTLHKLTQQTHPNVDIVAVICDDDYDTLRAAYEVESKEPNVRVMQYPLRVGAKPNKPKQLNYVFRQIKGEDYSVVGVFDAEDTVHPELLAHIDAAFADNEIGIVQGGVQLMNHDSSWYSLHNVLEYYRWFNSAMCFQSNAKFMPLGGNTIFVREKLLRKAGGWPETLTEDCSLGVLLSTKFQAKTAVYYEPRLATQEETPDTLKGLFKQRVRWNQGFFHEWRKGVWRDLPLFRQRLLASYVLLSPLLLACVTILIPVSLLSFLFLNAPVGLAMVMYMPIAPLSLLLVLNVLFLHDFGKAFNRKILLRHYGILLTTPIFYQLILNFAALWSVVRELRGNQTWYKTAHSGQHRAEPAYAMAESSSNSLIGERREIV